MICLLTLKSVRLLETLTKLVMLESGHQYDQKGFIRIRRDPGGHVVHQYEQRNVAVKKQDGREGKILSPPPFFLLMATPMEAPGPRIEPVPPQHLKPLHHSRHSKSLFFIFFLSLSH